MSLKETLSNNCAKIILEAVRSKSGWLQFVSEESKVNSKYLTLKTFRTMRWFRLVRILYFLSMLMTREEFRHLGDKLFDEIYQSAEKWEYHLMDEIKH